jgi:hypothetical protein
LNIPQIVRKVLLTLAVVFTVIINVHGQRYRIDSLRNELALLTTSPGQTIFSKLMIMLMRLSALPGILNTQKDQPMPFTHWA